MMGSILGRLTATGLGTGGANWAGDWAEKRRSLPLREAETHARYVDVRLHEDGYEAEERGGAHVEQ